MNRMKKYLLLFVLLLFTAASFCQSGKKPATKEKPPTQKELDVMMSEMQKAMDDMSPEDKKMMDSMGVKMPSMKNVPKVTDKQLADEWEKETRLVPVKNVARIAAIPQSPTVAALPEFISKIHTAVMSKLTATEKS